MAWVRFFRRPGGGNLGKVYQPGSVLSLAPTKGLLNEPGQNSCFLNSAVQVLWQLDIFRRSLRGLTGHVCLGDACIFCALKSIFAQFQHSREKALPSDIMRNALAESFKDEHRFQLGLMDDAAECFENILERIHFHIVPNSEGDMCTSKSCITHQKFAMTLYEQCVCRSCGASSDPLPFTEFVRYISTTALCNEVDRMLERHERLKPEMFAELLQAANTADDFRKCPSNCGQKIKIRRVLMNCPEIVTIGLVWDSEHSDLTEDVMRNLATQLYLPGLFYSVTDEHAKSSELCLVGMICYTSHHYCAFAYHNKSSKWVFFDDATVKEVGKWKDVVSKCIRCHFQPLLLFYSNPEGTAVSTEDALRQIIQWSHYKTVPCSGEDAGSERVPLYSKKSDCTKPFEFRECGNQSSGHRIESDSVTFSKGPIQASGGRGQVKVGLLDQKDRVKDISKECAQKAVLLKSTSSSQRKIVNRAPKRDAARHKESVGDPSRYKSGSPPAVYQCKSGSPPVGNGFRPLDHRIFYSQGRGPYKHERIAHPAKSVHEPTSSKPQAPPVEKETNKAKNDISLGYDTDNSLNSKDKGNGRSHRAWKPMRETLNVDSVFHETEKKQPHSPRHKTNPSSKPQYIKEQSFSNWPRDNPKQKGLTTIYEDESKLDTGSRSSLESEGKGQAEREKVKGLPDLKAQHQDSWQIQRTESGYESSDHISNGSTNLDSPIIEGTSPVDNKSVKEAILYSENQQSNKCNADMAENGIYSSSSHARNHVEDLKTETPALEVSCGPQDDLFRETNLLMQSTQLRRQEMPVSSKKFFPSSNLQVLKNHNVREAQMNRSNNIHSEWLQSDELACSLNVGTASSLNSDNSMVRARMQNEKECLPSFQLQFPPAKTSESKVGFPSSLKTTSIPDLSNTQQKLFGEPRTSQPLVNTGSYREPETKNPNLPPALPPKKYVRSTVPATEDNARSTNIEHFEVLGQVNIAGLGNGPFGVSSKSRNEKDVQAKDSGLKKLFKERNVHTRKPNSTVSPMHDCQAVPDSPFAYEGLPAGQSDNSTNENDSVSLTTYFSVDSCMTDTYRMKYHQRPRLHFSESSDFHRDIEKLPPAEIELGPTHHRNLNSRPLVSRSKPTTGGIHCNR